MAMEPNYVIDILSSSFHPIQTAMPGPFHIELTFFKAIGKIVEDSVGPKTLTDSGVLAPGLSNGFLQAKYFNRCRLLHPILALALEILHFQAFMKTVNLL